MGDVTWTDVVTLCTQAFAWLSQHISAAAIPDCRPTLTLGAAMALPVMTVLLRVPFQRIDNPKSLGELSVEVSSATVGLATPGPIAILCFGWKMLGEQSGFWLLFPLLFAIGATAFARRVLLDMHQRSVLVGEHGSQRVSVTSPVEWLPPMAALLLGIFAAILTAVLIARLLEGESLCRP